METTYKVGNKYKVYAKNSKEEMFEGYFLYEEGGCLFLHKEPDGNHDECTGYWKTAYDFKEIANMKPKTKLGKKAWNKSFSPIQAGKQYGYAELRKLVPTVVKQGHETHKSRTDLGLTKSKDKMSYGFNAHCVDSWTLAAMAVGGTRPDNTSVYRIKRIEFGRRNLHKQNPVKGGLRRTDGGTVVLPGRSGIRKGDLLRRLKDGCLFVASGNPENGLSLHDLRSRKRVAQLVKFKRLLEFRYICRNRHWFSWV